MTERALILLTNDDGYGSRGLEAMAAALEPHADVVMVAPEMEQSACGHGLTLHRALRLRQASALRFAVDGSPADCVYVALFSGTRILPRRPDLVVSGLNHGLNLGLDVYYSGTVAAAREAAMRGIPGLAVSADVNADLEQAAAVCARLARSMLTLGQAQGAPLINANVPAGKDWKLVATRTGHRVYGESVEYRRDPRGREYLWIGGPFIENHAEPGTDTHAFEHGDIGVSSLPLIPDSASGVTAAIVQLAKELDPRGVP